MMRSRSTIGGVLLLALSSCGEPAPVEKPASSAVPQAGATSSAGAAGSAAAVGGGGGQSGGASGGVPASVHCDNPGASEPATKALTFSASDEDFLNPERGFHDDEPLPVSALGDYRENGYGWVRSYVVLGDYRDTALPTDFLTQLDYSFELLRDAGVKVIVRFAYNMDGTADAPLDRVLGHIAQLAPVIQENADVIALLQAGFIGRWGEWHHSEYGLNTSENRTTILNALLGVVPTERMVELRYPWHRKQLFPELLTAEAAYTGNSAARVGLHNDCFVTSNNDLGTYGDFWDEGDGSAPSDQVERWMEYTAQESRFVVNGGETCDDTYRSGCNTATTELARFHYTYLNGRFNDEVNQRWRDEGCMPEIQKRLGYRLEMRRGQLSERVAPGGLLRVEFTLANVGYAAPFNARPVRLVLDGATRTYVDLPVDWRRFAPEQGEITVSAMLRLPASLAPGSYRVALWLPDAAAALSQRAEYSVRLANSGVWNAAQADNTLGNVDIDPAAPGCVDQGATTLSVVTP